MGVSAILLIDSNIALAAQLILFAACLDMVDGMIARKLNVVSDMGQILDSIVDEVSFCLAPALMLYSVLDFNKYILAILVYLIVICGALRLARFGSSESKDMFEGLPTPAFAMSISALIIAEIYDVKFGDFIISVIVKSPNLTS